MGCGIPASSRLLLCYLAERGIEAGRLSIVPADETAVSTALGEAARRSDAVFLTGGLLRAGGGLSIKTVLEMANDFLEAEGDSPLRPASKNGPERFGENRIDKGSRVLLNPSGETPGLRSQLAGCVVFIFPDEITNDMLDVNLGEYLSAAESDFLKLRLARLSRNDLKGRLAKRLGGRLDDVRIRGDYPAIDILFPTSCFQPGEVEELGEDLESYVYSKGADGMERVILDLLKEKGLTLSVAESFTGGMLASVLVSVPGSSEVFLEGFVTYSNEAKVRELCVSPESIREKGAVSLLVCKEMAAGAAKRSGSNAALSTTGIAGPTGASPGKEKGLGFMGLCFGEELFVIEERFTGERNTVRQKAVFTALDLLRLKLEGFEERLNRI